MRSWPRTFASSTDSSTVLKPTGSSHWIVSNTGAHDAARKAFFNEFDRLLHNVVAAIGTRIDHTRVVARHYEGSPFHHEFARRIGEVAVLPAARFVKDLRNYMLHQSLPAPYSQVNLSSQQVTYQLLISVPALLRSSAWSATSRAYLANHESTLPIRNRSMSTPQRSRPLRVDVHPVHAARRRRHRDP